MPVPGIDVLMYVPLFPVDALRPFPPTETPMPDFDRLRFTPLAIFTRFLKVHPMFYLFKKTYRTCVSGFLRTRKSISETYSLSIFPVHKDWRKPLDEELLLVSVLLPRPCPEAVPMPTTKVRANGPSGRSARFALCSAFAEHGAEFTADIDDSVSVCGEETLLSLRHLGARERGLPIWSIPIANLRLVGANVENQREGFP